MCALFGWLNCGNKMSHKNLKKLTQVLANAAEERGTDASGISYVQDSKIHIYKKPLSAHKIRFDFPENTTAVMGHTRMTTQGNEKKNFNNHPFYGKADKAFAFAHNGVLSNDRTLRKAENLPETHIETDSYVAVQLIENQGKLDFDSLKSMSETVSGSFCFTALDEDNILYIVKGSNPMFLIYFDELDLYVYASTESIMKKALRKSGLSKFKYSHIKLNEGDMISIDSMGRIDNSDFTPEYNFGFSRNWYNNYDLWETLTSEHEETILSVCEYFGASKDDVQLLFDYGYNCDEVEELIANYETFCEVVSEVKSEFMIEV